MAKENVCTLMVIDMKDNTRKVYSKKKKKKKTVEILKNKRFLI
jgi:hypothetical protein